MPLFSWFTSITFMMTIFLAILWGVGFINTIHGATNFMIGYYITSVIILIFQIRSLNRSKKDV